MRIVADTNVLFSAALWEGDSFRIMQEVEKGNVTLIISAEILREFSGVLTYSDVRQKILERDLEIKLTVEKIASLAKMVVPDKRLDAVKDDPDDNKVLECAQKGSADFIITNDNHLLKLREFEGIPIVTPKEFLKKLPKD